MRLRPPPPEAKLLGDASPRPPIIANHGDHNDNFTFFKTSAMFKCPITVSFGHANKVVTRASVHSTTKCRKTNLV